MRVKNLYIEKRTTPATIPEILGFAPSSVLALLWEKLSPEIG